MRPQCIPFWYRPFFGAGASREDWQPAAPVIGNDVWIGCGAVILRGAVIGDGAAIAAGAVVRGHVPAFAVFGGVPAKLIGYRFDEMTRTALSALRWWEWTDAELKAHEEDFASPQKLIAAVRGGGDGRP